MKNEIAFELYNRGSKDYRKICKLYNNYTDEQMKGMHVHHKDHDHSNNHPENLILLSPDDHAKEHGFINNFIMAQSSATERAAHPEVRKRASLKTTGEGNGVFGKKFKDFFDTEDHYKSFCEDHRSGENNNQYGNVGRISGDKNPMRNIEEKAKEGWLDKMKRPKSEKAKISIQRAARDPQRCKKISDKMKGNTSNQKHKQKVLGMDDEEFQIYRGTKKPSYQKQLDRWRNTEVV